MLQGKDAEGIRQLFGIINDFSAEEEVWNSMCHRSRLYINIFPPRLPYKRKMWVLLRTSSPTSYQIITHSSGLTRRTINWSLTRLPWSRLPSWYHRLRRMLHILVVSLISRACWYLAMCVPLSLCFALNCIDSHRTNWSLCNCTHSIHSLLQSPDICQHISRYLHWADVITVWRILL
jgi:hypothetical protein